MQTNVKMRKTVPETCETMKSSWHERSDLIPPVPLWSLNGCTCFEILNN